MAPAAFALGNAGETVAGQWNMGCVMEGLGWFAAIIVGALAGWIAEKMMKANHGLLMNIILGIVGSLLLNFILITVVGSTLGGWIGQLIVGVIGAMILIALGRAMRGRG